MPEQPLISIVMPAYNAEATISEAIQSVQNQTWQNWELLVAVDAATDSTLNIVNQHAQRDERIIVLQNPSNQGVAVSRNHALSEAQGDYVAFLDSDDLWWPDKLAKQVAFMQQSHTDLCYGAYRRFNDSGVLNTVTPPAQVDYSELLKSNVIPNLTGIVKRELLADLKFKKVGHEDFLFWLCVLQRTPYARRIPDTTPIADYRVQNHSLSSNKIRNLRWQWHIYRHELRLPVIRSLGLVLQYAVRAALKRI